MERNELKEKRIKEFAERFEESNLIEDLRFREVAKSKEAVEEILRTILNDDKLKVIKTIEQKNLSEAMFHGVILDCECILNTNEIVNIEVQIENNDNPIFRMRYNQSALTIAHSPRNKKFRYSEIPKIISIMLCDFDYFKLKKPIYEVKRIIEDTNLNADNGIRELYVNLKALPEEKNLYNLFKILTDKDFIDEKDFPNLSNKKPASKRRKGGEKMFSGITKELYEVALNDGIEEGLEKGREQGIEKGIEKGLDEGKKIILIDLLNQKIITEDVVMDKLNINKDELEELKKKYK